MESDFHLCQLPNHSVGRCCVVVSSSSSNIGTGQQHTSTPVFPIKVAISHKLSWLARIFKSTLIRDVLPLPHGLRATLPAVDSICQGANILCDAVTE